MPRAKLRTPALKEQVLRAAVSTIADERSRFTTRRIARDAGTSPAAIYELFDDRSGLLRAVFFDCFQVLDTYFAGLETTDDPIDDLHRMFRAFRTFARENPGMTDLMFSLPFPDFEPGPEEADAGAATRGAIVDRIQRCLASGQLHGDPTDIAHAFLALAQGLAQQEGAGWLGSSAESATRRWEIAFDLLVGG
jgi:AcrR family transcriptional regulator